MNQFYITVLSDSSLDIYPDNKLSGFQALLPKPVDLGRDNWEVGLCEFAYPISRPAKDLRHTFIYCDLIAPQIVGSSLSRCLRIVQIPSTTGCHTFNTVYYLPVEKNFFQTITVEILTKWGERATFPPSKKPTMLVLHFRKVKQQRA
jgi:hypothetical protein